MSVSLLLPMLGENNGTVFTDYSPTPKALTRYGDAKTVTAQSKYYGSSAYFDGSGDYLFCTFDERFRIDGAFTVEVWARISSGTASQVLTGFYGGGTAADSQWIFYFNRGLERIGFDTRMSNGSYETHAANDVAMPLDTWMHFAMAYDGTSFRLFADGVLKATVARVLTLSTPTTAVFTVGAGYFGSHPAGAPFHGYLQDLRITKDIARYTANFTPPARLIGAVSGVITDRFGQPCQRKVYAVSRPTDTTAPQIIAHGLSDATTGAYELTLLTEEEVTRIVVSEDDDPLLNDIIDRVIPA
jgi:hypothetical protein